MPSPSVAVVDIGSNSIKVLVATRAEDGSLAVLKMRTIEARIGAGISQAAPQLSEEGMTRGLEAVQSLLADAQEFSPRAIMLVATSAVRDARNGTVFRERVRAATGHEVRLLTGDEEAHFIGLGLASDPALAGLKDFYVFDLGGGSLECLSFRDRRVQQAVSLQLGCVRLTERFVTDPASPFTDEAAAAIAAHVRDAFAQAGFRFDLPPSAIAIGTGGTVSTVRGIYGERAGKSFEAAETRITTTQLRELLAYIATLALPERQQIPGLPAARADVFPAALATMIAVAELGHLAAFRHSLFNLRFGMAADLLEKTGKLTHTDPQSLKRKGASALRPEQRP